MSTAASPTTMPGWGGALRLLGYNPGAVQAAALALAAALTLSGCASNAPAQADHSASRQALVELPRKSAEQRVVVAIYEVSSNLQELPPRGATEQFKTALVKSGQFR